MHRRRMLPFGRPRNPIPVHPEVVGDFAGLPFRGGVKVGSWTRKSNCKGAGFQESR